MSCNHCNDKFISDCNYVTCLCNCKIHYQCLHYFNSLPHQWISSNPVKKHVISILTSSSFQYICTKCSTSNLSSSQYSSQTPISPTDSNNTAHPDSPYSTSHIEFHDIEKLINNISSRLDKQDSHLIKIDKLLNSHTYNDNDHSINNLHQSFLKSTCKLPPRSSNTPLSPSPTSNRRHTLSTQPMSYPLPSQPHYHTPISSNMPNTRLLLSPMAQFAPHTLHYSPTRPPNHHHLPRISTSRLEYQNNTLIIEHVNP